MCTVVANSAYLTRHDAKLGDVLASQGQVCAPYFVEAVLVVAAVFSDDFRQQVIHELAAFAGIGHGVAGQVVDVDIRIHAAARAPHIIGVVAKFQIRLH